MTRPGHTDPFAAAYLAIFGRPLDGDGTYLAAAAEYEPPFNDVTESEAREMQQAADSRTSEMFGPDRARCL